MATLPPDPADPRAGFHLLAWTPLAVGIVYTIVYARATAPGITELFDDTLEFQLVLPTFGIAHPTGYPLYTLLGALWSRVLFPVGEWAWRANLLSALCAGIAVGLACAVAYRLIRPAFADARMGDEWAGGGALLAAVIFALGPTWWSMATVAEVYALHNFFVALILWLALRAGDAAPERQPRALALLFLAVGLALAHHRMTLLLLPALAVYLLWAVPALRRPSRLWLIGAAAAFLPLLLYLLIPLRAAMGVQDLNGAYRNTWQGFWDHVLARQYAAFFGETALAVARTPRDWLALAVHEIGWVGVAGSVAGLALGLLLRGSRPGWALVAVALLANLLFAWSYRVGDVEVFLLPAWLLLTVAAGNGIAQLGRLEARSWGLAYVPLLLILLLLFQRLDGRGPVANRSADWHTHNYAVALAQAEFPPGSQVLGLEGEMTALRYMQRAHGYAPGVTTIVADDEAARRALLDAAVAAGAPVYLTRELPGSEAVYDFAGDAALVRVFQRGQARVVIPDDAPRLDLPVVPGALRLAAYGWRPTPGTGSRQDELTLYWQTSAPLTQTLKVSLRPHLADGTPLVDAAGAPVQQDLYPLRLVAPTPAWPAGATMRDVYLLPQSPAQPFARLDLVVYDANTLAEAARITIPRD
jgi:hypothetical protein